MWFAYTNNFANWHVLKIDKVKEIIAENKLKNKVSSLEDYAIEVTQEVEKDFNNAMGQESLTRFDQPKRNKRNNKKAKKTVESTAATPNAKKPSHKNKPSNKPAQGAPTATTEQKPAGDKKSKGPRKPIIIKKNEAKK